MPEAMRSTPDQSAEKQPKQAIEVPAAEKSTFDQTVKLDALKRRHKELSRQLLEQSASNPDNVELLATEIQQVMSEMGALQNPPMQVENALDSTMRMQQEQKGPITGDNIEDALQKAAEAYGEPPKGETMELESAMDATSRLQEEMRRQQEISDMISEELDKDRKTRSELSVKLAKLNAQQAEMAKDMEGVFSDLQKAANDKNYDVVGVYIKSAQEIQVALNKTRMESAQLQAKLAELGPEALETAEKALDHGDFDAAAGYEIESQISLEDIDKALADLPDMSAEERIEIPAAMLLAMAERAEGPPPITEEMKKEFAEEAKNAMTKNELSPDRKTVIQNEIVKVEDEIWNIKEGIELVDNETGKSIDKPGIKELETKLKGYGFDMNAIVEAKTDEEAEAAMKKASSPLQKMKRGLLSIFSPGYRKTARQYEERTRELDDAEDRLALSKLELKDPKKYAGLMNRRLMKTMLRRASQSRPSGPKGSPMGVRF